ncbi:hypothetical protein L1887_04755 [Cichorium endivia]|nr:hypothetical protein L1887_04755 [Cichorium endivia]
MEDCFQGNGSMEQCMGRLDVAMFNAIFVNLLMRFQLIRLVMQSSSNSIRESKFWCWCTTKKCEGELKKRGRKGKDRSDDDEDDKYKRGRDRNTNADEDNRKRDGKRDRNSNGDHKDRKRSDDIPFIILQLEPVTLRDSLGFFMKER